MPSKARLIMAATTALVLASLAATTSAQGTFVNGVHEDAVNGFQISVPDKWRMVPVKIDEKWIAAKYICHREYTNKGSGYVVSDTPDMKVLVFTKEKSERENKVEEKGDTTYTESKGRVFRNYDDFLQADMKALGLGYHILSQEEDKLGAVPVKKYTIKAETDYTNYLFLTWIYQGANESSVAVQFHVLEDRVQSLEGDFQKSFRTFRFIAKTEESAFSSDDLKNPLWTHDRPKWRKLTTTERMKMRREMQDKRREMYIATAPEGWFTQESKGGNYIALSHSDKGYTKRVLDAAEAMRDWLDKNIGEISDEYVMTGIVRICSDWDEFASYRDTSSRVDVQSFSLDDREIVDYKDKGSGTSGGGLGLVAGGLLDNYLYDKDSLVYSYLPLWMNLGLREYFQTATLRGGKLQFKPPTQESVRISEARRADRLKTVKELISATHYDWPDDRDEHWQLRYQIYRLIRFLDGPGQRYKPLKDFVPRYMKATITAAEEWREKNPAQSQAETVEEEEARVKERSERGKKMRRFVLDKVNAEMCNFDDKDWDKIEKAWAKFVLD